MARNGSGVYTPPAASYPAVSGTLIESAKFNAVIDDVATALTESMPVNGQTAMTGNLPMGTHKITGLGSGVAATDACAYGQAGSAAIAETYAATSKATPVDADVLPLADSAASFGLKKLTWANLKATLKTYFDSFYASIASLQTQTATAFTTGGTSTAFTLTPSPAITSLVAGQRFRVKFNATAGATPTLAISGLAATALKLYDSTGAKVAASATSIIANMLTDVEYDGTDMVILDPLPPSGSRIQPITASVEANALTCTLNPTSLDFRSATLGSGTVNTRTIATAISVVVPSTATLGSVNAVQSCLIILAIDNAGTVELAVVNISGGNNLTETGVISTTAISAAATANNVVYSTTARGNVPYRIVGYVESTQATAGTWVTAPSRIQGYGGQALAAMSSLGYGQTWQNVIGDRAINTTYYNTTGKPIAVSVLGIISSTGYAFMNVTQNGAATLVPGSGDTAGNGVWAGGVIPPNAAYLVTGSASLSSVIAWAELR